jgi:hypothetical protein
VCEVQRIFIPWQPYRKLYLYPTYFQAHLQLTSKHTFISNLWILAQQYCRITENTINTQQILTSIVVNNNPFHFHLNFIHTSTSETWLSSSTNYYLCLPLHIGTRHSTDHKIPATGIRTVTPPVRRQCYGNRVLSLTDGQHRGYVHWLSPSALRM